MERVARESSPFFCVLTRPNGRRYINVYLAYLVAAVGKFVKNNSENADFLRAQVSYIPK